MSGHRPGARLIRLATAFTALAFYALWIRPQMLTSGATPGETIGNYPGDELVPDPDGGATMATFLPTPPEKLWPWLVQMGGGRAGWYSWDWLDNNGEPSADRVVPEWQNLEVGRHLKGPTNWWSVVALEPNRTLVLQSSYGLLTGRSFDPRSGLRPRAYVEGMWGFHLRPDAGGGTRLVIRTRSRSRPRLFARPFGLLVGEPVHFVMQDSPVPQPARAGRRRGVTWVEGPWWTALRSVKKALQRPRREVPLEDAPPTTYLRLADFWDAESGPVGLPVWPLSHWPSPSLASGTLWPGGLALRRVADVVCVGVEDGPGVRIGNCTY